MSSGSKLNGKLVCLDHKGATNIQIRRFKLHLRSKIGVGKQLSENIPPLPLNKSVTEVIADYLTYLLHCASTYIQDTHANGPTLWASLKDGIDFVLSHPNGWEGTQQTEMRKAAALAKLIPDNPNGHSRLSFVTEGEASLHFSIQNGLPDSAMTVWHHWFSEFHPADFTFSER